MIGKKWRNSIRNCEPYNSFCSIGNLNLVILEYNNMVTQRYNELYFKEYNLEPSKSYENVIIANKEASKTLLPKKRKFQCPAQHADIAEPRKMVNEAYELYVISNSKEDFDNRQEAKSKL